MGPLSHQRLRHLQVHMACAGVVCLLQPHARPACFEHVRRLSIQKQKLGGIISACNIVAESDEPCLGNPTVGRELPSRVAETLKTKVFFGCKSNSRQPFTHHNCQSWPPSSHQSPVSSSQSSSPSASSLASSPPSSTPRTSSRANYPRHPRLLYGQQLPLGW